MIDKTDKNRQNPTCWKLSVPLPYEIKMYNMQLHKTHTLPNITRKYIVFMVCFMFILKDLLVLCGTLIKNTNLNKFT